MAGYGECALRAVDRIRNRLESPEVAWKVAAVATFPNSRSLQEKGCPRGAFLGLCEEGFLKGIRRGKYTRSKDNKWYAIEAVQLLKSTPYLSEDAGALWRAVPGHPPNENGQIEVVLSLWRRNLII